MNKNRLVNPFKPAIHPHKECLQTAILNARRRCEAAGQRFTRLRQRVLELVWQDHMPVKAYDILDKLGKKGASSAPPTVYRALNFLQQQGLVHKIESLNAYVGCSDPKETHSGQFFICHDCNTVAEIADIEISRLLKTKAREFGFRIDGEMIEIKGICHDCLDSDKQSLLTQ